MNYEIIDAHIHPFMSDATNLRWFGKKPTHDEFVKSLKAMGVKKACGSVIGAQKSKCSLKELRAMNDECLAFRDAHPDFFIPGIQVHLDYPQESCAEVERLYKEEGVRWVGELVGYFPCFDFKTYVSPKAFEVYALLQKLGLPVNIHDFNIEEIDQIAEAFPKLNIIVAHPCDGDNARNRIAIVAKRPNLHLDISGHSPDRWGMIRHAVDVAGKDKILFGSDAPICNPAMYIALVENENLTEEEAKAVFSGNFKRLSGLA